MQISKKSKKPAKRGTVILHQFAPTDLSVNGSPPCLKLETFLRMAKIPYENDYRLKFSKKGKMPWIEFNEQEIADSNFCIQALVYCRWLSDYGAGIRKKLFAKLFGHIFFPLKHLVVYRIKRKIRRHLWSQGIGRHSEQGLYGIAERDLLAVSEILGQKKFLFGEKPCLADVSLFAFIAASAWDCPESPFDELIKSKATNLNEHARRMKELYYPDWDKLILKKYKF
ncbi:hypothetical protein ACROYT_G030670 [Oculina patagonica]